MKRSEILFLILVAISYSCGSFEKERPFFFVQLTDPQFGFIDDTGTVFKETELYEKAITAVNRIRPAFVVITGDFVNDRSDLAQWEAFKSTTAFIDPEIPVFFTPGNHDIGQNPTIDDINRYEEIIGLDRFSFEYHNSRFIGFNSTVIKSGFETFEKAQYEWLEDALSEAANANHTVLFCHHPLFISSPDEAESYSNFEPVKRFEYLRLFSEKGVDVILAGHYHNNGFGNYDGLQMVTTSAVGKPLGEAPSGMRIVRVFRKKIESEFLTLDSIPERIAF